MWYPMTYRPDKDGEVILRAIVNEGKPNEAKTVFAAFYEKSSNAFYESAEGDRIGNRQITGWQPFPDYED